MPKRKVAPPETAKKPVVPELAPQPREKPKEKTVVQGNGEPPREKRPLPPVRPKEKDIPRVIPEPARPRVIDIPKVAVNPGGAGGVPRALARLVAMTDLHSLRLFIDTTSLVSGRMPSVEEIRGALRKEAPRLDGLIEDKSLILTGTRSRENVWAYTGDPGGGHLVVTGSGILRMTEEALRERLEREGK